VFNIYDYNSDIYKILMAPGECAFKAILHKIIRSICIPRQRERIAAQSRDRRFHICQKITHAIGITPTAWDYSRKSKF